VSGSARALARATTIQWHMRIVAQLLALIAVTTLTAAPTHTESLDQSVAYLLDYIANSHAVFIRNGVRHTPAEAVAHIKDKAAYFKDKIKTPEDFIRLAASSSLLTGSPYLVIPPGRKEMRLDLWLSEALRAHRAATHS
jgi:Family of unknown function (DUF5329)